MLEKFVMGAGSTGQSVDVLIRILRGIGDGCMDQNGSFITRMLSPAEHEAAYEEAFRDFEEHREEILTASARRGGVTTAELLARAKERAASEENE